MQAGPPVDAEPIDGRGFCCDRLSILSTNLINRATNYVMRTSPP